jgi:hypothetical protein
MWYVKDLKVITLRSDFVGAIRSWMSDQLLKFQGDLRSMFDLVYCI